MIGWIEFWSAFDLFALGVLMTLMIAKRITVSLRKDNDEQR